MNDHIEIRPFRNGWQAFESRGVQAVFLNQQDAIDYATGRARFVPARLEFSNQNGAVEHIILFNVVRSDEMLTAFVELQRAIHEFAVSSIS